MDKVLFDLLKKVFEKNANVNVNDIGREEAKQKVVPNTKKELETTIEENFYLLDEATDLETALTEFFSELKTELEEYIEQLEVDAAELEEVNPFLLEEVNQFRRALKFAIEVENYEANDI